MMPNLSWHAGLREAAGRTTELFDERSRLLFGPFAYSAGVIARNVSAVHDAARAERQLGEAVSGALHSRYPQQSLRRQAAPSGAALRELACYL